MCYGLPLHYQRSNENPSIEGQTIQWPKEKGQKDKQQSTKHYTSGINNDQKPHDKSSMTHE